jgi:hypothetical protein
VNDLKPGADNQFLVIKTTLVKAVKVDFFPGV